NALRAAPAQRLEDLVAQALALTGGPALTAPAPTVAAAPALSAAARAGPVLRVLALGPARVFIGQRSLAPADWTYAKAKELLFYLLTRGPAGKAQIGLDLWPNASPGQLRASFHSVLHHLRRALGRPDWIIHTGGEYAVNRALPLEYDVWAFEEHLRL